MCIRTSSVLVCMTGRCQLVVQEIDQTCSPHGILEGVGQLPIFLPSRPLARLLPLIQSWNSSKAIAGDEMCGFASRNCATTFASLLLIARASASCMHSSVLLIPFARRRKMTRHFSSGMDCSDEGSRWLDGSVHSSNAWGSSGVYPLPPVTGW